MLNAVTDVDIQRDTDLGITSVINDGFSTNVKSVKECFDLCSETEGIVGWRFWFWFKARGFVA